jgi:hypothetical protein
MRLTRRSVNMGLAAGLATSAFSPIARAGGDTIKIVGPLPRRCDAGFKRTASSGAESSTFRLADYALRCFVGTAECGDLELTRQDS